MGLCEIHPVDGESYFADAVGAKFIFTDVTRDLVRKHKKGVKVIPMDKNDWPAYLHCTKGIWIMSCFLIDADGTRASVLTSEHIFEADVYSKVSISKEELRANFVRVFPEDEWRIGTVYGFLGGRV